MSIIRWLTLQQGLRAFDVADEVPEVPSVSLFQAVDVLVLVDDSSTLIPIDQPEVLTAHLERFLERCAP